jgi:hypothetical protein
MTDRSVLEIHDPTRDNDRSLLERMAMVEVFVVTVKLNGKWDVMHFGRDLAQATWECQQWRIELKSKGKDHVRIQSILIDDEGKLEL